MKFKFFSEEQKQKVLFETKMFIEEMKNVFDIDCFLCGGVLLGSQREKDFIPHDQDIDLYYISKYSDNRSRGAINEKNNIWQYFDNLGRGKKFFRGESSQFHIWLNQTKNENGNPGKTNLIDLFGAWCRNDGSYLLSGNYSLYECKIPNCILPLRVINFKGINFNVPNKTKEFLDFFYGKCWRNSFICPKFPPGEIEQAVKDMVLWEYWRGTKDDHKKLTGFGRKKLGYLKLNKGGTIEWGDDLHKFWKYEDNKVILSGNKKTFELYQIQENEYETQNEEPYIKIKKIMPNNEYINSHQYFDKKICSEWFK
jgi:hypothetical protein